MSRPFTVPLPNRAPLVLGERTLVMGIVNVTPDSFADGGARLDPDVAARDAIRMVEQGADLLDIGGESTRPGAPPVSASEELARVVPVLERLRGLVAVPVSIDTYKAEVAARAIELGATIVNDVSGLTYDAALAGVVAASGAAVVIMHTRGRSADMYGLATYSDVVREVVDELGARVRYAEAAGISRERILLDPGLGFAKRAEQSFAMLAGLPALRALDCPVLVGASRKSFLKAAIGEAAPGERVWGTAAAVTAAVLLGAHVVRVHDVAEMVQVVRVADKVRNAARLGV